MKFLFLFLVACGTHTLSGIGGTCNSDKDCTSGLTCETGLPGGACTLDCTPNAEGVKPACPSGSTCILLEVENPPLSEYRCVQDCTGSCTRSGYSCQQTSVPNISVCAP